MCAPIQRFAYRVVLGLAVISATDVVPAAEKSAAELLPASVVGYLEVARPPQVLSLVLDHPLAGEVQKLPPYQQALQTPQYEQFAAAIKRLEEQLGMPWRQAAGTLTSGGLYFGFDLPSQGVIALARADGDAQAEQAQAAALDLARSIAAARGQPDPVKQDEHRGVMVYEIGPVSFATCGPWLIAANKRQLVWMAIDNDRGVGSALAGDDQFQAVQKLRPSPSTAWLYVDLRVLRLAGGFRKALSKKSDNPPIELIAGGIIGALPDAPYVTAALDLGPSRAALSASLPCQTAAVAKSREFYLGAGGKGTAPPLLQTGSTILSLATYRDFASLWRNAPDLFDEKVNARLVEAESKLTTFFAGRSFRDDILGNLEPGLQVVIARQEFPQAGVTPAIQLPAVAAVLRMKNPEETTRLFKVTFQSFVGFLNIVGANQGIGPLEQTTEMIDGGFVISSEFLPPPQPGTRTEAPLQYNASPTIAFVGDRVVLSSAKRLARELAAAVHDSGPAAGINTRLQIDAEAGRAALAANRGPLVAQNMLQKGHDRAAAEKEIDGLLQLLAVLQSSSLALAVDDSRLTLTVEVTLADRP